MSLLNYYQDHTINPVPISLDGSDEWHMHVAKRRNLYERHLSIPCSLLRGRSVLEFGCNSGENALVLAHLGAILTLVEPNNQVFPRLKQLFKQFELEKQLVELVSQDIDTFESEKLYDVVIAEGFLTQLPNRGDIVKKICGLIKPNGLGIISIDDRYGHYIEMTRKLVFWRAYRLKGIDNVHGPASLKLAKELYSRDFERLNASRPFEAWWNDVLVNPFIGSDYLWSYDEVLPILEEMDCEILSSSPKWTSPNSFAWYKNVPDRGESHRLLLDEWARVFPFFLTGLRPPTEEPVPASPEVVNSVADMISCASHYAEGPSPSIDRISYPSRLSEYLESWNDPGLSGFNGEMKELYESMRTSEPDDLVSTYHRTKQVRNLWGAPCHYLSFVRNVS